MVRTSAADSVLGQCDLWQRDVLNERALVMGGRTEEELVFFSVLASEAQAIQLEDELEMREQYLDLFRFAP